MNRQGLSPLFHPVHFKMNHLEVLDETRLPFKEVYIKVSRLSQALDVLRHMKTRAFGQVLLFYYFSLVSIRRKATKDKKDLLSLLEDITISFSRARPTFAFRQLSEHLKALAMDESSTMSLEAKVIKYIQRLQESRRKRAGFVVDSLVKSSKLLSHCNISGELVLIAELAKAQGKDIEFFLTETRPYLQGSRLSGWELSRAGFSVTLLADSQAATVIKREGINLILVGSDRSTKNGDIINKVGTYQLAVFAHYFAIPFMVLTQPPGDTQSIQDVNIEYRDPKEILEFNGRRLGGRRQKALYPAFDITPANLISRLVHFGAASSPEEFSKYNFSYAIKT